MTIEYRSSQVEIEYHLRRIGALRRSIGGRHGAGQLARIAIEGIWNRGELALADVLFTADYVNHGGLITDLVRGPEAIKFSVALFRTAFPTFHIAIDALTADQTAAEARWVAYDREAVDGSPRKGRGLRGITRCRLERGKIAESWTIWDRRSGLAEWAPMQEAPLGQA
jgi:hypothetical protein